MLGLHSSWKRSYIQGTGNWDLLRSPVGFARFDGSERVTEARFFWRQTDRRRSFFLPKVDAERRRSACSTQHPGHPSMWQRNHLDRRWMFCGDFCNAWAFDSHIWSPFRGCGASKRLSACGAGFMNPKHHMHTQRCFGMAISMKAQWRGLFGLLSSYNDCACDAAFHGRIPCTKTIVHMPSEVSDTFCWPLYPDLARLEDLHALRT